MQIRMWCICVHKIVRHLSFPYIIAQINFSMKNETIIIRKIKHQQNVGFGLRLDKLKFSIVMTGLQFANNGVFVYGHITRMQSIY